MSITVLCKWLPMALLGVGFLAPRGASGDDAFAAIQRGASEKQVLATLGKPMGRMQTGARIGWLYKEGSIYFLDGTVLFKQSAQETLAPRMSAAVAKPEIKSEQPLAEEKPASATTPPALDAVSEEDKVPSYALRFTRASHPDSILYGKLPVEFEEIDIPEHLVLARGLSALPHSPNAAREQFRQLRPIFRKYPPRLLQNTINCIYMVRHLATRDGAIAAISDPARMTLYLARPGEFDFHYALLLPEQFPEEFDLPGWKNLSEVWYGLAPDASASQSSTSLLEHGFVDARAVAGPNEDFAVVMSGLFNQPDRLFDLAEKYPLIGAKVERALLFIGNVLWKTTGVQYNLREDVFGGAAIEVPE